MEKSQFQYVRLHLRFPSSDRHDTQIPVFPVAICIYIWETEM